MSSPRLRRRRRSWTGPARRPAGRTESRRADESELVAAYAVADIREAEAALMATVPPGALMQRAATALSVACARMLREHCGGVAGRRVVLLVGAGDNGGDALWAGQRLAGRGVRVDAVLTATSAHAEALSALRAGGGRVTDARGDGGAAAAATVIVRADLVVDGLVGLGGSPGLREPAAGLVAAIPDTVPVVAVDLPSGVDPDSGQTPAEHVTASVTVTFGAPKPCLLLPPACRAAGRVEVVDIGLGPYLPVAAAIERLTPLGAAARWPVPGPEDDKYRRGVLGVVAGSAAYPGAAVLVCAGALRAGVGMVRYVGPPPLGASESTATALVHERWPEVVAGPGQVQAWVLGPGLDLDAAGGAVGDGVRSVGQREVAMAALESGLPCVVDAGALGLCTERAAADRPLGEHILLTPHAGELARLLVAVGVTVTRQDVEARPLRHARLAADRLGAAVLLKGATTLVVTPDGRVRSQADAPGWLATAGAGDVLAGLTGALLATGMDTLEAASTAALVHGRAAIWAGGGGPVTAGDVAEAVPTAVAELLAGTHAIPAGALGLWGA